MFWSQSEATAPIEKKNIHYAWQIQKPISGEINLWKHVFKNRNEEKEEQEEEKESILIIGKRAPGREKGPYAASNHEMEKKLNVIFYLTFNTLKQLISKA